MHKAIRNLRFVNACLTFVIYEKLSAAQLGMFKEYLREHRYIYMITAFFRQLD